MGDKRKQKRTTKKTNWENLRSWVGAVLCIAIIIAIATYVAKLVPGSSAQFPRPIDVTPIDDGVSIAPNPAKITFDEPIQITGNLTDPWEDWYNFISVGGQEEPVDAYGDYVLFYSRGQDETGGSDGLFLLNWKTRVLEKIVPVGRLDTTYAPTIAAIYGDNVVFSADCNIWLYNIPSKTMTAVTTDVVTEPYYCPNYSPDIYKNIVVWSRHTEEMLFSAIWKYNVQDGSKRAIDASIHSDQRYPRIFENRVIWFEFFSFQYFKLVLYDMKEDSKTILSHEGNGGYSSRQAGIYNGRVVWEEIVDYEKLIFHKYIYNIDSGVENLLLVYRNGLTTNWSPVTNGVWEWLQAYYCGIDQRKYPVCVADMMNRTFYRPTEEFYHPLYEVVVNGQEDALSFPPPHDFQIFFGGTITSPPLDFNLYMVKGVVWS